MNKYELLEDMKKNMLTLVGSSDVPIEVKNKLQNWCNELRDIVSRYNSNPQNILEYIDMNYMYIENMLKNVNNEKINSIADGLIYKCRNMEKRVNENEEENHEQDKAQFREIVGGKNIRITNTIIETFHNYIRDIASRAAKILECRGYSDNTIYEQRSEINQLLRYIESSKSQEDILQQLEMSDRKLLDKVLEQYENYRQSMKSVEKKEQEEKSTKEKLFRNELQDGAPDLEEQKNNSINFLKEQEENQDVKDENKKISSLDDIFLL